MSDKAALRCVENASRLKLWRSTFFSKTVQFKIPPSLPLLPRWLSLENKSSRSTCVGEFCFWKSYHAFLNIFFDNNAVTAAAAATLEVGEKSYKLHRDFVMQEKMYLQKGMLKDWVHVGNASWRSTTNLSHTLVKFFFQCTLKSLDKEQRDFGGCCNFFFGCAQDPKLLPQCRCNFVKIVFFFNKIQICWLDESFRFRLCLRELLRKYENVFVV